MKVLLTIVISIVALWVTGMFVLGFSERNITRGIGIGLLISIIFWILIQIVMEWAFR